VSGSNGNWFPLCRKAQLPRKQGWAKYELRHNSNRPDVISRYYYLAVVQKVSLGRKVTGISKYETNKGRHYDEDANFTIPNTLRLICYFHLMYPQRGMRSWDSPVSVVTSPQAGQVGFDSRQGQELFLFATASRLSLGPLPPSLLSNGYRGSFPGGKAAGA
jgi:hypothetical protein